MDPLSAFRRALIRKRFRRTGIQFGRLLMLNLPGLAETRGACGSWCIELPIRIVEVAFKASNSRLLNRALFSVRRKEFDDYFKSTSLCCLALLLSMSRTMPSVSHASAERFVTGIVPLYGDDAQPNPLQLEPLLSATPPSEWFATTLWLNMFLRTSGHRVVAEALTSGVDHSEQLELRILDSVLLELVSGAAQELLIKQRMLENYVEAAERDGPSMSRKEHTTAYDALLETGGRAIIEGCKSLMKEPITKTSDERILTIYSNVGSGFRKVSEERGERLTAGVINRIVIQFVAINEKYGERFLEDHLRYELTKYRAEGLRADYRTEIDFFSCKSAK